LTVSVTRERRRLRGNTFTTSAISPGSTLPCWKAAVTNARASSSVAAQAAASITARAMVVCGGSDWSSTCAVGSTVARCT
jgi:hypothetical protein